MQDDVSQTTANVADPSKETTITCFMAAICRDLTEGGNGYRYFGSLGAWTTHQRQAIRAGLLTADGNLTAVGRRVGDACRDIPADRAYAYSEAYEAAAMSALKEQH